MCTEDVFYFCDLKKKKNLSVELTDAANRFIEAISTDRHRIILICWHTPVTILHNNPLPLGHRCLINNYFQTTGLAIKNQQPFLVLQQTQI